ncbi:protein disulfide-isomerase precursor [Podochytrium sp. JEL0797]|nr:protein disulfide-isomerase precursor [Podochytrium sp. JEL0797]
MLRTSLLSLCVLLFASAVAASCSADADNSRVQVLSKLAFFSSWAKRSSVKDPMVSMVSFCSSAVPECKPLEKEFNKMATALSELGIEFGSVDCAVETEICEKAKGRKLPMLKAYYNGKVTKYVGEQNTEQMTKFMLRQVQNPVRELKIDQVEAFKSLQDFAVLGYFANDASRGFKEYMKVARNLSLETTFGYTFGFQQERIITHSNTSDLEMSFSPKDVQEGFTKASITAFVKTNSLPLIGDLDDTNFGLYQSMKLPIGFTFVKGSDARQKMMDVLTPLAKRYRGAVNFLMIDGEKFDGLSDSMNVDSNNASTGPQFVINEFVPEFFNYPLQGVELLGQQGGKELAGFLERYVSGELKPLIKSESVVANVVGGVQVVVGNSFEELVMDTKKDVLLLCIGSEVDYQDRFEKTYNKLAKLLHTYTKNISVAKINLRKNALPKGTGLKIDAVPKLLLVKSVEGQQGKGSAELHKITKPKFTVKNLLEFLEKNSNFAGELQSYVDHGEL